MPSWQNTTKRKIRIMNDDITVKAVLGSAIVSLISVVIIDIMLRFMVYGMLNLAMRFWR